MFQECHSPNSIFRTNLIREKRKIWALENDVDLLNQLEAFSQRLVDRAHSLLNQIQDFEKDLKVTRIEVKTLSNNFESVADNQFVENRVFDEEEDLNTSFQRKHEELPSNNDKNTDLEAALLKCTNILESKFEAVNIPISDSEDETDVGTKSETVFLPKNKYKSRPLPHLIGGEDFYKDDSLGLLGIYDRDESMNDNIMNGDDEIVTQSESSSIDEPDESSVAQDYSLNKHDIEANSLSDSKDHFDTLFNNQAENIWKDNILNKNNEYQMRRDSISSNHPESISDKKFDTNSVSEKSNSDSSCEYNQPNARAGGNLISSMHDELKQLFAGDMGEKKSKLKVFEKSFETDKFLDKPTFMNKVLDNSSGTSKMIDSSIETVTSQHSPNHHSLINKSADINISPKATEINQKVPYGKSFDENEEKQLNKQILKEDSLLPNVQTEILPSFAKERAKIKGKRRLPSRKSKSIEKEVSKPRKNEIKENPVLSPSTDEEDLFLLPQAQIGKESPASSLFARSSLFSPGSSIEESKKSFLTEDLDEKLVNTNKEASHIFDEPLGVHKALSTELKSERSKQLFKDWDPFDSDDGELFPSLEKGNKSKLFDNLKDSPSKSTQNDEDNIFFEKSSASSSKLFGDTSSTFGSNKKKDKSKLLSPRLFSDDSDDESEDLFSGHSSFKTSFLSSDNSSLLSTKKSGSLFNEPEKSVRKEVHSNPLLDPDDNLFD